MVQTTNKLPNDVLSLQKLLIAERSTTQRLQKQIHELFESLRLARHRRFGAASEKAPGQGELFDEAENENESDLSTDANDSGQETAEKPTSTKKPRPTRKPLPASIPRIRNVIELSEQERECSCGCQLTEIGEDISEQLDIVPAKLRVIQHVRKKYACKSCEEAIRTAPCANTLLPKAIATSNTMAYVITAKYADGLPLYRLSTILHRHGIDLSRQTLSESVLATAQKITPFIDHLKTTLIRSEVMHMDETTVQVLNEPGKTPQSKSYMWVQRGGPPDRPVVLFSYDPSRSSAAADNLLVGYNGALMSDGYAAYQKVAATNGITHLCCWAHARRKFVEAQKARPKGKTGRADKAIAMIAKLYAVEKRHKQSTSNDRQAARAEQSDAILQDLKDWLENAQGKVPPTNALGKAIAYTLKLWPELTKYTGNGVWPIDNNVAENAIRPFVIGRKAWMFSTSQRGAKASANLYSLIETAKANSQEPYQYLSWLFENLPKTNTDDYEKLMPWNMPASPDL